MSEEQNNFFLFYKFRTLAQHCHNIERLDLSDCKKITDQAIHAISKHCAKLTSINLESCVNITDKSLKDISDGCPVSHLNDEQKYIILYGTFCYFFVWFFYYCCRI